MDAEPLRQRLEEIERACDDLERTSARLRRAASTIASQLDGGIPVPEILRAGEGLAARRDEREAWSRVNGALHAYRVALVRHLVDDDGLTISEAARVTGNARQVVSRLYHDSVPAPSIERNHHSADGSRHRRGERT